MGVLFIPRSIERHVVDRDLPVQDHFHRSDRTLGCTKQRKVMNWQTTVNSDHSIAQSHTGQST